MDQKKGNETGSNKVRKESQKNTKIQNKKEYEWLSRVIRGDRLP